MVSMINGEVSTAFPANKNREIEPGFGSRTMAADDEKQRLDRLYRIHHRQIYNLCFRVTKNSDVAETITVRVFVQFYKELKDSDEKIEVAAYLRKLAVGSLLNHLNPPQ